MKKTVKKLLLSKETLGALTEDATKKVAGRAFNTYEICQTRMVSYCDYCMPMD